jgi:hypothetical protein
MPDNLSARPLAADNISTDYISGSHHLRVKVQHGADNSATDVSSASPLPVSLASGAAALAPSTPVTLAGAPPVSQVISATPTTYRGIDIRETAGAPATVVLYNDAAAATGAILGTYSLAASESRAEEFPAGRAATVGIWAAITGTVQGSVFKSA